jgi:hypothetical protein
VVATPPPEPGLIEPKVEALIKASGIDFRIGGSRAFYMPAHDYVQVPRPDTYFEPINWHRTALHELGHWIGHPSRLARDLTGGFGSASYAKEELVAEMTSAFVCASLGIVPTVRHADYIGSRLECCAKTIEPSSAPPAPLRRQATTCSPSGPLLPIPSTRYRRPTTDEDLYRRIIGYDLGRIPRRGLSADL